MTDEPRKRILVVDDEPAFRILLHTSLIACGYAASEVSTGAQALQAVATMRPDLILLDLGLGDMDGEAVIAGVRAWNSVPIIVLSVKGHEEDKVTALDAGADDYLTKPFSIPELQARIRAALRRGRAVQDEPLLCAGNLKVDLTRRLVTIDDRRISLTRTEYSILRVLALHAGTVVTHRALIREVWGGASNEHALHLLHVTVSNLRRKLDRDPQEPSCIATEPGVGYRLIAADPR